MGKGKVESSGKTFINVSGGEFRQSHNVDANTPGSEKIVVTNPKDNTSREVSVLRFKYLTGIITSMHIEKNDKINKTILCLDLYDADDDETMAIQMGWDSAYARNFVSRLPNVDMTKDVLLMPYSIERDDSPDKFNMGIAIHQKNGPDWDFSFKTNIKHLSYWTKDTPHDMPQMTDKGIDGDWDVWVIKSTRFLKNYVDVTMQERLGDAPAKSKPTVIEQDYKHEQPQHADTEEDDLPF